MPRILALTGKSLRRSWRTMMFASIGIIVGVTTLVAVSSFGVGFVRTLRDRVFPTLPPNQAEIAPRQARHGLREYSFLGAADVEALRSFPGVRRLSPRIHGAFPCMARLDEGTAQRFFGGMSPVMDLPIDGVSRALIEQEAAEPGGFLGDLSKFRDPGDDPGEPVPVLVSKRLYALYIAKLAPSLHLPPVPERTILNLRFLMTPGRGFVASMPVRAPPERRVGQIVGISRYAHEAGATLPYAFVERANRKFAGEAAATRYASILIEADSPEGIAAIGRRLEEPPYMNRYERKVDRQAQMVIQIVTILAVVIAGIATLIIGVSAVHIGHTFFMLVWERRIEIGILRSVGASRLSVAALFLGEACFLGVFGGAVGLGLGAAVGAGCDALFGSLAPDYSYFRGESFFALTPAIAAGAVGAGVLFSAAGALFPAVRAARLDPARALTQE